ncbi:MAG: diguanylate cyclase, partial [Thiomonas sp.]
MISTLRKYLLPGLLWLPALLAVVWFVNQERMEYGDAREQVANQARHAAMAEGQLIQLRLAQQFQQLVFVARGIVGEQDPDALDVRTEGLLRRFAAEHQELFALNIQSPDGSRIVWSSHSQPRSPIFLNLDFTPLSNRPDDLLGQDRYAPRYGGEVLAMRYRVRDALGRTLYFVGSPYRVDTLLASSQPADWRLVVRDLRDGSVLGVLSQGRVTHPPSVTGGGVKEVISGLPLAVEAHWSSASVWQLYRHNLAWRLVGRALVLAFFMLAALIVGRLLRSRQQLLQQNDRLARFNAMLAHVNQAIVQAGDVPDLLETVCRLAVRDQMITLAWIGRPDDDGNFVTLSKAGPAASYVEGLVISVDGSIPEGLGSTAIAWREDRAIFTANAQDAANLLPWRERLQRFGLRAQASLPLYCHGKVWAVLNLYCGDSTTFTPVLQRTMLELADDLSRGLDRLDLLRSQALLQHQHASLLDNTIAGVVMVRYPGAIIVEANAAIARIFGVGSVAELVGRGAPDTVPTLTQDAMIQATRTALKHGNAMLDALDILRVDGQSACIALSGQRIETADEGFTFVVWTVVDVTERQQLLSRLERISQIDPLTDLPNRRALELHLERAVARAERLGAVVGVGLIDLDDFKPINDRHGHEVGDALLKQLSERLQQRMRGSDMIARLGGDEFVVVIEDLDEEHAQAQLGVILARMHQAVQTPFDLGNGRIASVGMSMGVALSPADGRSADALLRLADAAMYRIKSRKT